MTEHHWSGWPGAYCLKCGAEDASELCLAGIHGPVERQRKLEGEEREMLGDHICENGPCPSDAICNCLEHMHPSECPVHGPIMRRQIKEASSIIGAGKQQFLKMARKRGKERKRSREHAQRRYDR